MNVHLTPVSSNKKVGAIPVSTTSQESCPDTCQLKDSGCYAMIGPLMIHWRKVTEGHRGNDWDSFCQQIKALPKNQLWRHNQAGDLAPSKSNVIDRNKLNQLVNANRGRRGFTYTHYSVDIDHNAECITEANQRGFTINLSTDNVSHADQVLGRHDLPVVTLMPLDTVWDNQKVAYTAQGRTVVRCPAEYRDTNCADCGICAKSSRSFIVGFTVHGTNKRRADIIAKSH